MNVGLQRTVDGPRVELRDAAGGVRAVPLDVLGGRHLAGTLPWRRPRSRRRQRHIPGEYWSATTGGHVVFESQLELARLLLADFDPAVSGIFAQPFRLAAEAGGRMRSHVPDFLLMSRDSTVTVVNVKPVERLEDPAVAQALAWPERLVAGRGWRWEIWTGSDRVMVDNVRFLAAYRRPWVVSAVLVDAACQAAGGGAPLAVVERRLAGDAPGYTVRPAVLAALWRGSLVTDLTRPLSGESVLRRPR